MKGNFWVTVGLLAFGAGVGFLSVYFASVEGLMTRLGLVSGDLRTQTDVNMLARGVRDMPEAKCDWWGATAPVPAYLFGSKGTKITMGLDLGRKRIGCGIEYILQGNSERGVYTVLKGLYYIRTSYLLMGEEIPKDKTWCQELKKSEFFPVLDLYVAATQGRMREVVQTPYEQLLVMRLHDTELCLDRTGVTF